MIEYYCIHHKPAKHRFQSMRELELFQEIQFNWVCTNNPYEQKILNHETIYSPHAANRTCLNAAELSVYYKHLDVFKIAYKNENDFSVILEDDVENPEFSIKELVEFCSNEMIKNNIFLVYIGSGLRRELPDGPMRVELNYYNRLAHGLLINNKLITDKFIEEMEDIKHPLDIQLEHVTRRLQMPCGWSYPHIFQKTQQGTEKSLLR